MQSHIVLVGSQYCFQMFKLDHCLKAFRHSTALLLCVASSLTLQFLANPSSQPATGGCFKGEDVKNSKIRAADQIMASPE